MPNPNLFSVLSLVVLAIVYFFLISEKLNKVIVVILGACLLVISQVFRTQFQTSQDNAFGFISHNLDILGFVIGMMILIGIVRESGVFEAMAIWLVKKVRAKPFALLAVLGYLTLFMTMLFSNIPTVLIIMPITLILIKQLKLPYLPFLFIVVAMANIGGAATPISDPTTYYQAKTVGLGFVEVLSNSGLIVLVLSVVTLGYVSWVFRHQLRLVKVSQQAVELFSPKKAIRNKKVLKRGVPILIVTILTMVSKDLIYQLTGVGLDNATITLAAAFYAMLMFHREPRKIFADLIDWEIIFFFMGLFVIVGALEFTQVIEGIGHLLTQVSGGSSLILTGLLTTGSALLSTFIDNVPYNITMVGAIQTMADGGVWVYPLWWALNLGTSIGGAGSPIAAACNVIAFGQAHKDGYHTKFGHYLKVAMPLVLLNSLITFGIIYLRYF